MSQHDFNIANQGFPATRADINNAFQAIASNSSGPTAPSTTYANMWWYDTTNNKMYLRNEADSAWIEVATIDQTNNEWQITTGVVRAKDSDGLVLRTDDGTTRLALDDATGDILFYEDTGATARMRWDASAQQLIIDGDGQASDLSTAVSASALEVNGDVVGGSAALYFGKANLGNSYLQGANSAGSSAYDILLNPYAGNVGIGTYATDPAERLTVYHATNSKILISTGAGGASQLYFGDNGNDLAGRIYYDHNGNSMRFHVNADERMRIDQYGRMAINNSSPYAMLHVTSSSSITGDGQLLTLVDNINRYGVGYNQTNASFSTTMELRYTQRTQNSAFHFLTMSSNAAIDTEFRFRGDGQAYADGSFNGGGADYAEYFEWADGNTADEDRVGFTVVLDGDKIRKATSSDNASEIIGAVSANPSVIGDGDIDAWKHRYLRDDFGRYIRDTHNVVSWTETIVEEEAVAEVLDDDGNVVTHAKEAVTKEIEHSYEDWNIPADVTVPDDATTSATDENGNAFTHRRPNPDYNPDQAYVTREERPEWATIGMMGKLRIRTGQPVGDRWIKMRDVSDTVEEWLVR